MDLRVGTSGFSYAEWKGGFYPEGIRSEDMLEHYAATLSTVEINNTFYRMPRADVLERWSKSVPADFRFVLKASRRITHQNRLSDCKDSVDYLWDKALTLGPKLGAILFQLPPKMKADQERLETFLAELPQGMRAAFEFRHESWNDPTIHSLITGRGHTLCISDAEEPATNLAEILAQASWCYFRLRRETYTDAELRAWLSRIDRSRVSDAFIFFKHEEDGAAPQLAQRMLELWAQ